MRRRRQCPEFKVIIRHAGRTSAEVLRDAGIATRHVIKWREANPTYLVDKRITRDRIGPPQRRGCRLDFKQDVGTGPLTNALLRWSKRHNKGCAYEAAIQDIATEVRKD